MTVDDPPQQQLDLLRTLAEAVTNAAEALQAGGGSDLEADRFSPPADGLSLLDVKNSLLLSYLQSLVLLILVQLRQVQGQPDGDGDGDGDLGAAVQRKLTELRVYLERGVRPIEGRLKYQIDSALRAADGARREDHARAARVRHAGDADDVSDSGDSEAAGRDEEGGDDGDDDEAGNALLYKPNLAVPSRDKPTDRSAASRNKDTSGSAVYRAPRVNPTAMPDPDARSRAHAPRKRKSQLLNEYIDEELSSRPHAQPSIGSNSTILERGRAGLSQRERERERERRDYEERNFTRLPAPTKKERRRGQGQQDRRDLFGGEDWTGLGGLGDRVSRSVVGGGGGGGGGGGVLRRREKRRATEDLPRGDGRMGSSFDTKRRVLEARAERRAAKR